MKNHLIIALLLFLFGFNLSGQAFRNLGFEYKSAPGNVPQRWMILGKDSEVELDSVVKNRGKYSLQILSKSAAGNGSCMINFPLELARGKKVIFKGKIKTRTQEKAFAGLWFRVDGKNEMAELGYDEMEDRRISGDTDWREARIEMEIDTEAIAIYFGGYIEGAGTAWFDNFEIWIDGQKFEDKAIQLEKIVNWITETAAPLKTVEAEQGTDDLQFLKPILKEVKIVGLGEATHGTREFFQMKHRMLEFLVKEMGFTVFVLEASYPACKNINNYVLHGQGTKEEALASQGFWTWDTEEILDMIEWIRQYNQGVPADKKVKFAGIDIQVLKESEEKVRVFLAEQDTIRLQAFDSLLVQYQNLRRSFQTADTVSFQQLQTQMNALLAFLILNEGSLAQKYSTPGFKEVIEHLRILMQAIDERYTRVKGMPHKQNVRDYYMAENMQYLINREQPGSKFLLWAHNMHINANPNEFANGALQPLGSYLRATYGKAYYAISFAFNQGGFQAMGRDTSGRLLRSFVVPPADKPSFEYLLAKSGHEICFLNLRQRPILKEVEAYFRRDLVAFSTGSAFTEQYQDNRYYKHFPDYLKGVDGVIFIEKTKRAIPSQKVKERMRVK